ncbi:MAG: HEAT repeat domain-containing protein [Spirochaetaceae bacterium]|jgi:outer membrane protein assembly factor BamB|nr:HEAT repeat domain-containing protein [Spirochaetaceae bacterium]
MIREGHVRKGTLMIAAILLFCSQAGDPPNAPLGPLWKTALGGAVIGFPSVQAETVAVVCDGGNLKTFSRQGTFLWDYFARARVTSHITRSREGTSYICTVNGIFIVVNRAGRELWRLDLGAPLAFPVLTGWDGRIFIPGEGRISCYTAAGYPLWGRDLGASIALGPRADKQGGLLMVLENGEILRIGPFGEVRSRQLDRIPAAILPQGLGKEGEAGDSILVFYKDGEAEQLRWGDVGREAPGIRRFPPLPGTPLAAAGMDGLAALTLKDGRVILISGADGSLLWTGESHIALRGTGGEEAEMLFDERGIYVLSRSGASAFSRDGRRLWLLRLEGIAAVPAFGDDGLLFAGGEDWILYGYQVEERAKPGKRSLYGSAPEGSYGMENPPPSPWAEYLFSLDEGAVAAQLDRIEGAVRLGRIGEEEGAFTAYLMEIAGIFRRRPWISPVRPPIHFRQRGRACRLLGYIGSRETIPFLAELFRRDPESQVKAAAAEAIGRIGVDPEGAALRAFSAVLRSGDPAAKEDQVLIAIAAATGALCRFSGPPLSEAGLQILNALAEGNASAAVHGQVQRELRRLWR